MILACFVAWVLLTACGEYLLREALFLDGWRGRRMARSTWWAAMLNCFMCPWGWASLLAGVVVGIGLLAWFLEPWALVPLLAFSLPAFGLGLARVLVVLGPMAGSAQAKKEP